MKPLSKLNYKNITKVYIFQNGKKERSVVKEICSHISFRKRMQISEIIMLSQSLLTSVFLQICPFFVLLSLANETCHTSTC